MAASAGSTERHLRAIGSSLPSAPVAKLATRSPSGRPMPTVRTAEEQAEPSETVTPDQSASVTSRSTTGSKAATSTGAARRWTGMVSNSIRSSRMRLRHACAGRGWAGVAGVGGCVEREAGGRPHLLSRLRAAPPPVHRKLGREFDELLPQRRDAVGVVGRLARRRVRLGREVGVLRPLQPALHEWPPGVLKGLDEEQREGEAAAVGQIEGAAGHEQRVPVPPVDPAQPLPPSVQTLLQVDHRALELLERGVARRRRARSDNRPLGRDRRAGRHAGRCCAAAQGKQHRQRHDRRPCHSILINRRRPGGANPSSPLVRRSCVRAQSGGREGGTTRPRQRPQAGDRPRAQNPALDPQDESSAPVPQCASWPLTTHARVATPDRQTGRPQSNDR